jgi:hypothetical protein
MLTSGRTIIVRVPEQVWGHLDGDIIVLSDSRTGVEILDAEVRAAVPDPDVEAIRAGEVPGWIRDRMRDRPELFVKLARLDPEELAQVEGSLGG